MNDNERIPGTDVKPVPLPVTEPESEAALAIKPGAWVEICIPTNAALIEHPELQGAVLQVQSHDCTAHEVTAGDIIWPAHNVRVVEHPSDLKQRLDAMERDRQRLVKAKGLNLEALEGRVAVLEMRQESDRASITNLQAARERHTGMFEKLTEAIELISRRISNNKIGAA